MRPTPPLSHRRPTRLLSTTCITLAYQSVVEYYHTGLFGKRMTLTQFPPNFRDFYTLVTS